MLTLVLFLLFVHNSAVPMILQPLKSLANNKKMIMNKSLVEELADADPAQVQQLLDLIETMLLAAHTNLENLEVGCTNANNDYDTAVVTYDAALLSHTGNQEIFDVALEAKNAALEAKVFANGAKIEAQKILDQSKPGLDSEIKTLEEMIRLNGRLSSPNQGLTDMLQGMLKSSQTILGNLERACTNTINDYNDAVIAYNDAVIAYDAAQEKLRVSQEALNVAQDALNVAQGVKTEAQYVLDTGKPGLEVEISNLEEMLSIHGRLNPNSHFTLRAKTGNGKWDATTEKVMVSFYVKNVWTVPVVFFEKSGLDQVKSMVFFTSELPSKVKLSIGGSDGWRFTNIYIKMVEGKEYFFSTSTEWLKGTETSAIEMNVLPGCIWHSTSDVYSRAYANGFSARMTLGEAKLKCLALSSTCRAVTCTGSSCTVRASSVLSVSPSGETSHVPGIGCL